MVVVDVVEFGVELEFDVLGAAELAFVVAVVMVAGDGGELVVVVVGSPFDVAVFVGAVAAGFGHLVWDPTTLCHDQPRPSTSFRWL